MGQPLLAHHTSCARLPLWPHSASVHSACIQKAADRTSAERDTLAASKAGSAQLRGGRGRARTSGSLSGSSSTRSICLMPSMSCPRLSCCAGAAAAGAGAGAGAGGRGAAPTGGGGPTGGGRCGAVLKPAGGTGAGAWPQHTRRKLTTGPAVLGDRLASLQMLEPAAQAHKTSTAAASTLLCWATGQFGTQLARQSVKSQYSRAEHTSHDMHVRHRCQV